MEPTADAPEHDSYEAPEEKGPPPLPSLPARAFQVFFSPGALMDDLADNPRWLSIFLVSTALVTLTTALIPPELMWEMIRMQALRNGTALPEMTDQSMRLIRGFSIGGALLSSVVLTFLFALGYAVLFAFVLGDEGRFKQYLAALTHSWFIPAFLGLLMLPLWLYTGDLQLRPNVAAFLFFLPDGLLKNAGTALDLTQIWATLVFAQGVHAIDNRRSFGSAAAITLTVLVVLAFGLGWLQTLGQRG